MKKKKSAASTESKALDLIDEGFHLLRTAPIHVTATYFAGTVPFVAGFLFFWLDMSCNADAAQRCLPASGILALLFVWMKTWQAVFTAGLRDHLRNQRTAWSWQRVADLILEQTARQPHGLISLPVGILVTVPFPSLYSYYQNLTVLGAANPDAEPVGAHAWRNARDTSGQTAILLWLSCPWVLATGILIAFGIGWLMQSAEPSVYAAQGLVWAFVDIWLMTMTVFPLAPFTCIVAANVAVALVTIPSLMRSFFGLDVELMRCGLGIILNTTFLLTVYSLTYLMIDPLSKAIYVLRNLYQDSSRTGEDLVIELARQTRPRRRV